MVAIIKLVISAAILSQASAAAVQRLPGSSRLVTVADPVLAVPVDDSDILVATSEVDADVVDMDKRAVATSAIAVPTGLLIVGAPVLAVRPTKAVPKVLKAAVTSAAASSSTTISTSSTLVAVPTAVNKLVAGGPVLAVRPSGYVRNKAVTTTLATSVVVKAVPTSTSL